jgi:hypothetical protein
MTIRERPSHGAGGWACRRGTQALEQFARLPDPAPGIEVIELALQTE